MADPIDLLKISDTLDEINGEDIGAEKDYGMNFIYLYIGMSGQKMTDALNADLHAIDAEFLAIAQALLKRVISNQIKEIKEENEVVSYTTDGKTWKPLQASWGKIVGNIADQEDLNAILNDKIGTEQFNALASQVGTNSADILLLNTSVGDLENDFKALDNQINGNSGILVRLSGAEALLAKKITSEQVLEIRTVNGTALEFTMDGQNWYPVSSAGIVNWGQIEGNIAEQADLQLLLKNLENIAKAADEKADEHIDDLSNPHQVSKQQIGLGNVDNTSDADKPVSTAQREAIDTAKAEAIAAASAASGFVSLTKAEYEALAVKDENAVYYINDL